MNQKYPQVGPVSTDTTEEGRCMRVGIIGGGIAGLSAAYDLARQGHEVVIYESLPVVGGLAAGFKAEGWDWPLERFYHHLFASDDEILDLARDVGAEVFFRQPVTAHWSHGRPYPFDAPLPIPRFPGVSAIERMVRLLMYPGMPLLQRFRVGLVSAYLIYGSKNWRRFEQVKAHEWLSKWSGKASYEAFWKPLLVGKFGDHYEDVNLAWLWARFYKRSAALGYFVGGFQTFAEKLAQRVREHGGTIHLSSQVDGIRPQPEDEGKGMAMRVSGEDIPFDAVISTASPGLLAKLTPDLPDSYLANLRQLRSLGAVVMTLALDRPLTQGFYWINLPAGAGLPFLSLVEHTNYIKPERYGGDRLVYLGDYVDPDHRYFEMSDEELLETFLPTLTQFNPAFDPSWVTRFWVHKATYAQPIPPVNYSSYIPPLETPIAGLYFASMSQVYPWDRGTNYAVEIGRKVAREVQGYLSR